MKTCSVEGCSNPVWSKGACKYHAPKPTRSLRTKKQSSPKEDINQMREFFMDIWNTRRHYCENCRMWLGPEPLSYMFDHLLEKNKYPDLKYKHENIMLVCLDCHDKKTRGFVSLYQQRRIEYVIEKYLKNRTDDMR